MRGAEIPTAQAGSLSHSSIIPPSSNNFPHWVSSLQQIFLEDAEWPTGMFWSCSALRDLTVNAFTLASA